MVRRSPSNSNRAGLGYSVVGMQIAVADVAQAADRAGAIQTLIEAKDPAAILAASAWGR